LNIIAGVDQLWDTGSAVGSDAGNATSGRLELDSAVRAGSIVVENRGALEGDVDTNVCPQDATCDYGHVSGLKRQASRAIYDIPGEQIRILAGDTDALSVPLQRSTEVLGLSIEKSPGKLNPGENITSAGAGSFRLERASSVDVMINGAVVQRLQLRPGNYNLRDLPLTTGANDIELTITADNGERQTLSFSAYSDQKLLAAGKSEWALAAGLPSYLMDNERTYSDGSYLGTGFFRYGIRDGLTGDADLQGDATVIMGGVGVAIDTNLGIVGLHGAGSKGSAGTGVAADLTWSLANFKGFTEERGESLHFNAEYRSTDFHTPGESLNGADGILYPEFNYWLRLNGSYSAPVTGDITATVSGRYQFGDEDRETPGVQANSGDRYGVDLTLSSALTPTENANLLTGYSNEIYVRDAKKDLTQDADFRVALRFNVRPDEKSSVVAGYDTLGQQTAVSGYRGEGSGVGRWDTSIDVQNRGYEETGSINASAGYRGNRGELRLSHFADAKSINLGTLDGDVTRQRTSLRAGTSIAFAGSKVAIGAPIRGGAFAIVAPHESIAGKDVTVGTTEDVRAVADQLGNGLVSDLPAYLPASISVDVEDLPIGYSLGSGAFDTFAPYKGGYAIEVGSAYSVSVYGTMVMADGQPVSLITGLAYPEGQPGKKVSIFTNAEGRFGAEGLAPGRWIADMATEGAPTHFIIDVPEGTNGLVKAGTLQPSEGSSQ
ncbi:MAG: fimbria/pilus outer membrane usher protein, partial [Hyphomicrobium sp.]